jgi:hypothetical protein
MNAGEQVRFHEVHLLINLVPHGISARDLQGLSRHVSSDDVDAPQFACERYCKTATARAHIDESRDYSPAARVLQHLVDHELGFGTRNQDVGRDLEFETPELAVTDDHRNRLTCGSTDDQRVVPLGKVVGRRLASARVERRAVPTENVTGEHLGVEPGAIG